MILSTCIFFAGYSLMGPQEQAMKPMNMDNKKKCGQYQIMHKTHTIICIFIISLVFSGCRNWEYNVVKNGIHFKKYHVSENGTNTGFITENQTIQGFPCKKGWVHFDKNWQLLSFQISKKIIYRNVPLPALTWLHFPYHENQTGFICSFPRDQKIQGYVCEGVGGYKGTHTAFYDSGRLKSFFPVLDVVIDGIPCEASPFENVELFENGNLKSCKLAEDHQINGIKFKRGNKIELTINHQLNIKSGEK